MRCELNEHLAMKSKLGNGQGKWAAHTGLFEELPDAGQVFARAEVFISSIAGCFLALLFQHLGPSFLRRKIDVELRLYSSNSCYLP